MRIHVVVYPGGKVVPASDLGSALARVTARMEGGPRYGAEAHDYPGLTAAGYCLPTLHMASILAREEGRESLVLEIHDLDVGPRNETRISSLDLVDPDHPDVLLSIALVEAVDLDEEERQEQLFLIERELILRVERATTPGFPAIGFGHMLADMRNWSVGPATVLPTLDETDGMDDADVAATIRDAVVDRFRGVTGRMFAVEPSAPGPGAR